MQKLCETWSCTLKFCNALLQTQNFRLRMNLRKLSRQINTFSWWPLNLWWLSWNSATSPENLMSIETSRWLPPEYCYIKAEEKAWWLGRRSPGATSLQSLEKQMLEWQLNPQNQPLSNQNATGALQRIQGCVRCIFWNTTARQKCSDKVHQSSCSKHDHWAETEGTESQGFQLYAIAALRAADSRYSKNLWVLEWWHWASKYHFQHF